MNKGLKIVVNVVYYLFTIILGIVIAIMLPTLYLYSMPIESIRASLYTEDYTSAMKLIGGYFNDEYVFIQKDDDSTIVLFESVTVETTENEDEEVKSTLSKVYSGFIYNVKNFNYAQTTENLTKIKVTNQNDEVIKIDILDYDTNSDGEKDSIGTLAEPNTVKVGKKKVSVPFFYFEIKESVANSIKNITLMDCDGNIYKSYDVNLDFNTNFYNDVDEFVNEYNTNYQSEKLEELDKEFTSKSTHYLQSEDLGITKKANTKATIIVLIYFLCVYAVGDILISGHFIIKGIKWLLVHVFKIKFKKDTEVDRKQIFGHDYFSNVTFKLDLSEEPTFNEPVLIKYSNDQGDVEFNLIWAENYSCSKRVKAGVYFNPWIEVNKDYEIINVPENLNVEGYKLDLLIKIRKIKDGK